jgi:hypothetical protein
VWLTEGRRCRRSRGVHGGEVHGGDGVVKVVMRRAPLIRSPPARGRPSSQLVRLQGVRLLLPGDGATATCLPSSPIHFSPLFPLPPFSGGGTEMQKGKDPKLVWFAPGPRLGGFAALGAHGDMETAWARAVPSPFALAAKAQGAGRR